VVGGRCALVCVRGRGAVGGGNMAGTAERRQGWRVVEGRAPATGRKKRT
jgi:hypothetical protein